MREVMEVEKYWEKEEELTKEIVGRVHKEGSGTMSLEKRGCIRSKEVARKTSESKNCQPQPARIMALKQMLLLLLLSQYSRLDPGHLHILSYQGWFMTIQWYYFAFFTIIFYRMKKSCTKNVQKYFRVDFSGMP